MKHKKYNKSKKLCDNLIHQSSKSQSIHNPNNLKRRGIFSQIISLLGPAFSFKLKIFDTEGEKERGLCQEITKVFFRFHR